MSKKQAHDVTLIYEGSFSELVSLLESQGISTHLIHSGLSNSRCLLEIKGKEPVKKTRRCPKCTSGNVATERRLDGDSVCGDCGFNDKTTKFNYE